MLNIKKIDPSLMFKVKNQTYKDEKINCIVYSNSLMGLKNYIVATKCCKIEKEYPFINALGVTINATNLGVISNHRCLEYITSNAKVFAQVCRAKEVSNLSKFYDDDCYGKGITVAIIDTGIKPHLDFMCPNNRIINFKDFINKKENPYDDNGHGTFVASILGGNGLVSGSKLCGVAPKVNIISLKALDEKGETGAFTILEAMQWVYDNKEKYNIKIICMSFGSNPLGNTDPLKLGAETLWDNGVIVVAAAGNSGPERETIKSPGISSKIITVGALDDGRNASGEINEKKFKPADFSSRGPAYRFYKPDLIASGVDIQGASNKFNEFYTKMSGTSVATPIVAGVCALICEKHKNISPSQVKNLLLNNTIPLTRNRNIEGYGYLKIK